MDNDDPEIIPALVGQLFASTPIKKTKNGWEVQSLPLHEAEYSDGDEIINPIQMNQNNEFVEIHEVYESDDCETPTLTTENCPKNTIDDKLLFKNFFQITQKDGTSVCANCSVCKKNYKGSITSNSNFVTHLKVFFFTSYIL